MDEYKRNYKIANIIFKVCVITTLVWMLITPFFGDWFKANMRQINNISSILIIITIVSTFFFSKYKKAEKYVFSIDNEINDSGYFIPNYSTETLEQASTTLYNKFGKDNFTLNSNVEIQGKIFDFIGEKNKDSIFCVTMKKLDLDTFYDFIDSVNANTGFSNVRTKQNIVCCIVTRNVSDDVIALSKMTTVLAKSVVYPVIFDIAENKVYFLSTDNKRTGFIVKNILGYDDMIIPESAKCKEKLDFQVELNRKMYAFNITDYKNGKFNPRK